MRPAGERKSPSGELARGSPCAAFATTTVIIGTGARPHARLDHEAVSKRIKARKRLKKTSGQAQNANMSIGDILQLYVDPLDQVVTVKMNGAAGENYCSAIDMIQYLMKLI